MKKYFIIGILIFALSISYGQVYAQTPPNTSSIANVKPTNGVLVASVNLTNAKIILQDKNTFKIYFEISNGAGLQTGVKYGLQLISNGPGSQYIADEKVYDESLNLGENSITVKNITYTAPENLNGSYTLMLSVKNASNFPFAIASLGEVKLSATEKGVYIDPASCYLSIQNAKDSKHYTLTQGIDISSDQNLALNCNVKNETNNQVSLTPFFENRPGGAYGDVASQTGGDYSTINFSQNESKNISVILSKGSAPKFYDTKFMLTGNVHNSNSIFLNYNLKGASATIYKLSLDKDYYNSGDQAKVSLLWFTTPSGTLEVDGKTMNTTTFATVALSVKSGDEKCSDEVINPLTRNLNSPVTEIAVPIKSSCQDPTVIAIARDSKGNILDQKEFTFKTKNPGSKQVFSTNAIIVLFIILIIIALLFHPKSRKINLPKNN